MARTAGIVLYLFARTEHQRYGPHRQHRAALHVPRDGHAPNPVAILIHGGYWRAVYGKDDPRLDPNDVTLIGHSAGDHLALWATSRDDVRVKPQRVIAHAPVTNLVAAGQPAHALMGGRRTSIPIAMHAPTRCSCCRWARRCCWCTELATQRFPWSGRANTRPLRAQPTT